MSKRALTNLVAIAAIIYGITSSDTSMSLPSLPSVSLPSWGGASLNDFQRAVRKSMPERAKARKLASVAGEFARQVEFDGSLPEPRVTDTAFAVSIVADMNSYSFQGEALATDEFRALIKKEFDARFQADGKGKDLTPEVRANLVKFYQEIQHALE